MSRNNLTPPDAQNAQPHTTAEVARAGSSRSSHGKPILYDFFCGAGGCTKGYQAAGFYVIGIDIDPQPRYCGDEFIQADAIEYLDAMQPPSGAVREAAAAHASPPCPRYSAGSTNWNGRPDTHPDLVAPTRALLRTLGLPYVIENVPGAPMENPIMLCGSSFRLRVRRHRLFECSFPVMALPCAHGWQRSNNNRLRSGYVAPEDSVVPVYGGGQAGFDIATCREAMGIDWMTTDELNNAIPPAYTEHIGHYLLAHVQQEAKAA